MIAYSRDCVTASHEENVDGPKILDVISSLDFPFGTCFLANNIASNKALIKRENLSLCIQRTG